MQIPLLPTLTTTAATQVKDASNFISNGTQGASFQKMLSKEIQKENGAASKTESAQKNQRSQLNKAPVSKESTPIKESTKNTQDVNKEQNDSSVEINDDEAKTTSDLLSYVQDLNQLINPAAASLDAVQNRASQNKNDAQASLGEGTSKNLDISNTTSLTQTTQASLDANLSLNSATLNQAQASAGEPANVTTSVATSAFAASLTTASAQMNQAAKSQDTLTKATSELDKASLSAATETALLKQSQNNPAAPIDPALSVAANPALSSSTALDQPIRDALSADGMAQLRNSAQANASLSASELSDQLANTQANAEVGKSNPRTSIESDPKLGNGQLLTGTSFALNQQIENSELANKELSINNSISDSMSTSNNPAQMTAMTNAAELRSNAAAPTPTHIPQSVRSNEWNQALGNKIIWMAQDGIQTAQLDLNPPDLGPLQVVLNISNDNIDARFVSSHMEVRSAVEAAMPKLKEMMENTGLSLSGFNVSSQGTPQEQSQQQQDARNRLTQLDSGRNDKGIFNAVSETSNTSTKPKAILGQVDTFV